MALIDTIDLVDRLTEKEKDNILVDLFSIVFARQLGKVSNFDRRLLDEFESPSPIRQRALAAAGVDFEVVKNARPVRWASLDRPREIAEAMNIAETMFADLFTEKES